MAVNILHSLHEGEDSGAFGQYKKIHDLDLSLNNINTSSDSTTNVSNATIDLLSSTKSLNQLQSSWT